jgi:serine/threonine protein kinase
MFNKNHKTTIFSFNTFNILNEIGVGSFGNVFDAINVNTTENVVLKKMNLYNNCEWINQDIIIELITQHKLYSIKSELFVKILGICFNDDKK